MNPILLLRTSPMTARSISADMASCFKRPTDPQSVASRSHTILESLSSSPLAVSATISSISTAAPLPLSRVTHLSSITSRSQKTFNRFLRVTHIQHSPDIPAHPPCHRPRSGHGPGGLAVALARGAQLAATLVGDLKMPRLASESRVPATPKSNPCFAQTLKSIQGKLNRGSS
jgi:hypothetical protein